MFVDELTNLVGEKAVTQSLFNTVATGKLTVIGSSSAAAYEDRIESKAEIAGYFTGIPCLVKKMLQRRRKTGQEKKNDDTAATMSRPDLRAMMAEDPSGEKRVDVIIQAKNADDSKLRTMVAADAVGESTRIGTTNTMVANLPLSTVNELSESGTVDYISPDREIKMQGHIETTSGTSLIRSQPSGYGRSAAYTLDGSGVGIAVIDSGIDGTLKSFTEGTTASRVVYNKTFIDGETSTADTYGHGTHVASIAAGSATRNTSEYKGIAPKANLINLKVLNGYGIGRTSDLLEAINWVKANRMTYNIRVVNISLGTPAIDSMWNDPLCYAVQDLNALGILVVAASGNSGKTFLGTKIYGQVHRPVTTRPC